ncbi:MAG TPA: redox-regulated ATPase YchF [Bacteroidales bacterium]|jgi:GTP-binding protein YchF|nr:redox-regulated ATPase YchF [Bacteroidales bacterium]HOX76045.1 redox-regulated ATPase YchF [Bacteroidales bacterium]HPM88995.1 redox-regulated ATPase YchF [Bacteroidales bacterium]HQM67755.1 redox-regulated ATPase YchF [Bacteroidales bacterium]
MALQCGIIGIATVGKTTIFNCISDTKVETGPFGSGASKANMGVVKVPDQRLYELEKHQPTNKIVHTTVEIVDIPGLAKGSTKGEGGGRFLGEIRNTDALIHVIRCFDSDSIPHIEGSVDPVRDIETVNLELQVKDHESVEKKIDRFKKVAKSGDKDAMKGIEVLERYKDHLEGFNFARTLKVRDEEKRYIDDLFLLTMKPVMYVCNVDEKSALTGNKYVERVKEFLSGQDAEILVIAGAIEAEIAELENIDDRKAFLKDIGLEEPGVDKLVRAAYKLLDLQTFLTVGPKEIRAWTIKKGMTAPQAAGVIHSDLERGFIRAEVMKYNDFITLGSEHACRDAGKLYIEGKNYIVEDGDILNIRFNV